MFAKRKYKNDEKKGKPEKKETSSEYLGPDGVPILTAHNIYLNECLKFKAKARKYKQDNENIKNSLLLYEKPGYEGSEKIETNIFQERKEHWNQFNEIFDQTFFDSDPEAAYKCLKGKSKRIRIIREVQQPRKMSFSKYVDKNTNCWFLRYNSLSRFIQAGRKIIILNRLNKVLMKIRNSKTIAEVRKETKEEKEHNLKKMTQQFQDAKIAPCFKAPQKCCHN